LNNPRLGRPATVAGANPKKKPQPDAGRRLLVLALKFRPLAKLLDEDAISFFPSKVKRLLPPKGADEAPEKPLSNNETCKVLSLQAEVETINEKDAAEELKFHINEIKKSRVRSALEGVSFELNQAENKKDAARSLELHQEFNALSKSIQEIQENNK